MITKTKTGIRIGKKSKIKFNPIKKFRNNLILKLAGNSPIVLNTMIKGGLEIEGNYGMVYNCTIVPYQDATKTTLDIIQNLHKENKFLVSELKDFQALDKSPEQLQDCINNLKGYRKTMREPWEIYAMEAELEDLRKNKDIFSRYRDDSLTIRDIYKEKIKTY
jgi:hypothetical protein